MEITGGLEVLSSRFISIPGDEKQSVLKAEFQCLTVFRWLANYLMV